MDEQALINETARRIFSWLDCETATAISARANFSDALALPMTELKGILADFKRAIESVSVRPAPDPSVVQLIEEARSIPDNDAYPVETYQLMNLLADALEQQVAARKEAEDRLRVLSVRIGTPIQQLRDVADVDRENEQLQRMNAVLKYDWLALCGLRDSYINATDTLRRIARFDPDAREALKSMIDPPPENVKYQGSWPWALSQMKAGRIVARGGYEICEQSPGGGYYLAEIPGYGGAFWTPISEDFEAIDWQLIDSTPTGESEANDE